MISGKKNVICMFEEWQQPYFALFYKGKMDNAIRRNDKEENEYDYMQGRERFERALELLEYGDYSLVVGKEKDVTKRGGNRVDFKIPINESAQNTTAAPQQMAGIGSVSADEVERIATDKATVLFNNLMDKRELEDTKKRLAETEKELKEAERRVTDPFNKLIGAMAPYSENIIAGIMGRKQVITTGIVSGIKADAVSENDADAQNIMEDFIHALSDAKPDTWKQILQQLTNLIKENPGKFDTALTFL